MECIRSDFVTVFRPRAWETELLFLVCWKREWNWNVKVWLSWECEALRKRQLPRWRSQDPWSRCPASLHSSGLLHCSGTQHISDVPFPQWENMQQTVLWSNSPGKFTWSLYIGNFQANVKSVTSLLLIIKYRERWWKIIILHSLGQIQMQYKGLGLSEKIKMFIVKPS